MSRATARWNTFSSALGRRRKRLSMPLSSGAVSCSGRVYITSGFRYLINDDTLTPDIDDPPPGGPATGELVMAGGGLLLNGDLSQEEDPNVQADTQIFGSIASHANGGNFVLLTAADSLPQPWSAQEAWLTTLPTLVSNAGNPFHSVEVLQYFYDDSPGQFPRTDAGLALEAADAPNQLAKAMASDWFAKMIVDNSAAIFLGGGDQWRYTACWEGSELADTIGGNTRPEIRSSAVRAPAAPSSAALNTPARWAHAQVERPWQIRASIMPTIHPAIP